MGRKTQTPARYSALEKQVKANTREIKKLKKRVDTLERAFSKELASIHEELMKTMFEAFGFVPPTEIGSEADKYLLKKHSEEGESSGQET